MNPLAVLLTLLLAVSAAAATPAQRCESAVAGALRACTQKVAVRTRRCHLATVTACPAGDATIAGAVDRLARVVRRRCPDAATVRAAGYGTLLAPDALVARVRETCLGEPATLVARTFGGPQAAQLAGADGDTRACLGTAFDEAAALIRANATAYGACLRSAHRRGTCDVGRTTMKTDALAQRATARIAAACPALQDRIGLDAGAFVARAAAQSRCLTATAHGDTAPLALDCGPRPSIQAPPRGTWVQVVLDEAVWGTRCGTGAPYAFWLRLAPEGARLDRVVTSVAPGGVCISAAQCAAQPPEAFLATDDAVPSAPIAGYLSTDPAVNPFHDWTMLYLPYCTQDIHLGNGVASVFSDTLTVYRYGALNLRAGLRYLRDVLWTALDQSDPAGWHPDRLTVLFGGESAGGHGVRLNYHYLLDDLRWVHATAVPDAGLGLDNGAFSLLGTLVTTNVNPFGWDARASLPTYCQGTSCLVGPILQAATSARLGTVPGQQILMVSNQIDDIQRANALFPDMPTWTNTLRALYCANRGLPGLQFFLGAWPGSTHVVLRFDDRLNTFSAGGVTVRDWLAAALADPFGVVDHADEGALVTDVPGILPIPCP